MLFMVAESLYPVDISEPGWVARVRTLSPDRRTLFFDLPGGTVISATLENPSEFEIGDVVIVADDQITRAPESLWPDEPMVGVVRLKLSDISVVDSGGRWHRVPTVGDIPYRMGNTVEFRNSVGVERVLHPSPIKLIDLGDLDENVVEAFKIAPDSAGASFDSVGGLEEVIARAKELIELPLKSGDKLAAIGARPIKGVLFTGPAGTGKTMLGRIIAARSGATFYNINGPEIFSKWYGQSEELLRLIFKDARKQTRSIIFFDEIDSVASQRNEEAHEASRRVVAQLLTLLDGFSPDENIVVLATTNRPSDIDQALRRPGRLDWQIEFPLPSKRGREDILRITARRMRINDQLPLEIVAERSEGWTGAELVAIWTEASLLAVSDERDAILVEDFLGGWQRVATHRLLQAQSMGPRQVS